MRALFDAVKSFFTKKRNRPLMDPQISKPEPVVFTDMSEFFEEIDEHVKRGGTMTFKISKAPATLVAVGFGKEYNNKLAIRKGKSQQRNWSRWKNKK